MNEPQPPPGPWGQPDQWTPPAAPADPPPSLRTAVRLMWVGAALTALGILAGFLQTDEMREQFRESDSSLTADEVDTLVAFGLGFATVIGLISVGLWIWMANANGQGKSWARVVATVFGGLNLLFTLVGLVLGQQPPLSAVLSIVGIVLAVVILVLLYRPDSNRYYDQVSAASYGR